ncbi:MAG: LAGLIDADG family homing endonuclease [Candidatus Altiarchaeota archaeon]|nr:LAGLIDADG family homing endonuclease [Candidatus Altiarchaeota archaeon]
MADKKNQTTMIDGFLKKKNNLKEINVIGELYPERKSLFIDYEDLEKYNNELADEIIQDPDRIIKIFNDTLRDKITINPELIEDPYFHDDDDPRMYVRFYNLPKQEKYTLLVREITSDYVGKLISVEGVINKQSDVLPKVRIGRFVCNKCDTFHDEPQNTRFLKPPIYCEGCKKRDFRFIPDESKWTDIQKLEVQEPLEMLKGGEQARRIEIWVEDDLTDTGKPGDKIVITGIVRLLPPKQNSSVYFKYIEANNIERVEKEFEEVDIEADEIKLIKKLAKDPRIYDSIIHSIAPGIYGYNEVKEAIALQLFGGRRHKRMPDGTLLRPDIHLLLIGDPGVAKSRVLQYVNQIAPKSIYVTGKGATGAGLCVDKDSLVFNSGSLKPIHEVIETNFSEELKGEEFPGAYYNRFSLNTYSIDKDLKLEERETSRIWRIKAPESMVEITTSSGRSIKVTPNTPLITLTQGGVGWMKAKELREDEYVATARFIPLKEKPIPAISILRNKKIRIGNNISGLFSRITDRLSKKYGGLDRVAQRYGISRERLYRWRSRKYYQGIPLLLFMDMGREAGFTDQELAESIKVLFLRHGKSIRIPKRLNNPELGYLAGLIGGDGSIYRKGERAIIRFYNNDEMLLDKVASLALDLFEMKAKKIKEDGRVPYIRINSLIIADILSAFGLKAGKKSHQIDISWIATSMGKDFLSNLLRGLFETDGWVYSRRKGSSGIGFLTSSPKLAQKMQLLLLGFGIYSKIRKRERKGEINHIRGREIVTRNDQFCLEIRGKENLIKFKTEIGFYDEEKREILENLISNTSKKNTNLDVIPEISDALKLIKEKYDLSESKIPWVYAKGERRPSREKLQRMISGLPSDPDVEFLKKLSISDMRWERIKKKEILTGGGWVYDFTVPENNNFLSNGFWIHNTATAEKDEFAEGGWTLKAGALVLAGGGIACIDEFDKMNKDDRSSMHEAMEQQTISVAKAGIVAKFLANTAILAASNPKFSRFDSYKPMAEQFDIPPTLISRFDLIFPIRDILDKERDTEVADHILKMHQTDEEQEDVKPDIDIELLRKYIAYARKNVNPVLTKDAVEKVRDFYVGLRSGSSETVQATPRQLEALVRLSEASAKIRLSDKVTVSDTERAIRLTSFVLREIAYDADTGLFDIDRIAAEHSKTSRDRIHVVEDIIRSMVAESQEDMASHDEIIGEVTERGIDRSDAEKILGELKNKGVIYEPRHGRYMFTEGRE